MSAISKQCMQIAILFQHFYQSVCPMPVLCQYEWTHRHIFFTHSGKPSFYCLSSPITVTKFQGDPFSRGVIYIQDGEILQISLFVSEMVKDMEGYSYYGTQTGNHR